MSYISTAHTAQTYYLQQSAATHILFECNIQSIINTMQQKPTLLTSTTLVQECKKLNSKSKAITHRNSTISQKKIQSPTSINQYL